MKRKFQFIALNVLIAFQDMASLPPRRPRQAPRPHCGRHGGGDGGIQHPMYTGSVCASFRRSTVATAGAESRLAALWRDRRLVGHPAHGQQGTSCTQQRAPVSFSNRNVTILLCFCNFRKWFGNFQFPTLQRVSPEIKIDFFVDSRRVDAISGLLRNLMAAWKPKVGYFFFRTCHKVRSE